MKTRYYLPEYFQEEFDKLIKSGAQFEYERTTFTKKLRTDGLTIFFNQEGKADDRVLSLINKTRNDAKDYIEKNGNNLPNSGIYFLDMFQIPESKDVIMKVDLTSAYWKDALKKGIITQDTDDFLNTQFTDYTQKALKGVRLKALGSLATRKEVEFFQDGKSIHWDIKVQPTKPLYMAVCKTIDDIMRNCRLKVDGCIFYYWDCMFVRKEFAKDVVDFFKSKDFECTKEETRLTYDKIGTKGYITSEVDGKMYLVSSENRNLIKNI